MSTHETTCPECRLAIEGRAAILEHDAGLSRDESEARAATSRCHAHPIREQAKPWRVS